MPIESDEDDSSLDDGRVILDRIPSTTKHISSSN